MIKYLLYTVFALVLTLVILEIGLRISGRYLTAQELAGEKHEKGHLTEFDRKLPSWYWRQPANLLFVNEQAEYRYDHQYNSFGFREEEFDSFEDAKPKVIVLGDSFIEGYGAPADSTFPSLLQNLLSDSLTEVSVINLGMGGSDVFFNYMDLVELLPVIQPSHVIMTVNSTDFDDYRYTGGFERFLDDGTTQFRKSPFKNKIHQRSHLARFWYESIKGMDYALMTNDEMNTMLNSASIAIRECIDSTYNLCTKNNISFMLMTYAIYNDICSAGLKDLYIEKLNTKEGFYPMVEIRSQFEPLVLDPDCYQYGYPVDGHFNSRGYRYLAESFYNTVDDNYRDFWKKND